MTNDELIALAAAEFVKAKSMSSDAGSVTRRDASDFIAFANYVKGLSAASNDNGLFGLRVRQAVPGGPGE